MIARMALPLAGGLVLLFGLACLNYTNAWGVDHHAEWAAANGMPAPSEGLLRLGMASAAFGGVVLGFGLGRRKR